MGKITDEVLVALSRKIPDDEDSRFTTALCTELLLARKSIDALINDISTGMYVQALQLTNSQLIKTNDNLRKQLSTLQEALDTKEKVYGKLLSDYTALKEKQA